MIYWKMISAVSTIALLSGCLGNTVPERSDDGRLLAAIEAEGCSIDPNNPPSVDYKNAYDLNPGMKRTPENDQLWAKVRIRTLKEQGHLVEESNANGQIRIRSVYGDCA